EPVRRPEGQSEDPIGGKPQDQRTTPADTVRRPGPRQCAADLQDEERTAIGGEFDVRPTEHSYIEGLVDHVDEPLTDRRREAESRERHDGSYGKRAPNVVHQCARMDD